jgi:signal transduction histidine kinase
VPRLWTSCTTTSARGASPSCRNSPDTPIIYADRQKLRQVFLNLIANAGDAMPQVRHNHLPPWSSWVVSKQGPATASTSLSVAAVGTR